MALRVQGVAPAERLASALAVSEEESAGRGAALVDAGLAESRTLGRLSGLSLTGSGKDALESAMATEGLAGDAGLGELYERFLVVNQRLLKICSDWQVRRHGGAEVPNDHRDADYDQSVIDRLCELHDSVRVLVRKIVAIAPRFAPYLSRLDGCIERACSGDRRALTAALAESYHTVWFELHQDLILTLGVEREE
jgi:hypothetical protein